nr:hypothetical protein [Tanacetum cinerariifolium]GFD22006.1 hypothetical protein [Tanacetum cinerariifolium]
IVLGCIPDIVRDQLLRNFHSKDFINFTFRNELEISKTEIIFSKGQAHVSGVDIREPVAEVTRSLHVVEGKGKVIAME